VQLAIVAEPAVLPSHVRVFVVGDVAAVLVDVFQPVGRLLGAQHAEGAQNNSDDAKRCSDGAYGKSN
jgi:hypothetical protein